MARIPQSLHSAVRRVLWPAESAMRRLIVIAARGLVVKLPPRVRLASQAGGIQSGKAGAHVCPSSSSIRGKISRRAGGAKGPPGLNRASMSSRMIPCWVAPRPAPPPAKTPPPSDALVNAVPLTRRLEALKLALEDLPRQARRMARWQARREAMPSPKFRSPLRPGRPPGSRRKPIHLVDEVLIECHGLAWDALKPDTS